MMSCPRSQSHGHPQILAAAELLTDSHLNHNQASFLQTIQACGMSLVETVNHVLDFTKLVGNSKSDVAEHVVAPSKLVIFTIYTSLDSNLPEKPESTSFSFSKRPLTDVGSVIMREWPSYKTLRLVVSILLRRMTARILLRCKSKRWSISVALSECVSSFQTHPTRIDIYLA